MVQTYDHMSIPYRHPDIQLGLRFLSQSASSRLKNNEAMYLTLFILNTEESRWQICHLRRYHNNSILFRRRKTKKLNRYNVPFVFFRKYSVKQINYSAVTFVFSTKLISVFIFTFLFQISLSKVVRMKFVQFGHLQQEM